MGNFSTYSLLWQRNSKLYISTKTIFYPQIQFMLNKAKAMVKAVAKTAHDQKVVGSNSVTSKLYGSGVKATQDWLIHPAWIFLDASNYC